MKKFEKILKIIAIISVAVLIMGSIGTALGIEKAYNEFSNVTSSNDFFDKGKEIVNSFNKDKVKSIKINADLLNVIIKEDSNNNEIKVTSSHEEYTKMELINGTLSLRLKDNRINKFIDIKKIFNTNKTNRQLVIYLPKDYTLGSIKSDIDVGSLEITGGSYKNLDVSTKIGEMKILNDKYTLIDNLKVENNLGDTEITNLDAANSEIENSMGSTRINIANEINPSIKKLEVDNKMGDVFVTLKNIDRNIEISSNMGSVTLISKNNLCKNVAVSIKSSIGEANNNFKHSDVNLGKTVNVNVESNMGSVNLTH